MIKFSRITAFTLAFALSVPSAFAAEGTITAKVDTALIPGVTYSATTAQTSGGQIKSYTMTVDPSSTAFPITAQGTTTLYSSGNVERAIEYAEAAGYNILGAINSDYFSLSTGVAEGIVIENGIYKSSPSHFSSVFFDGNQTSVFGEIVIPINIQNHRSGQVLTVHNLNKYRMDTGGLYLLNSDFSTTTRTNSEGIMVRLRPTYETMEQNGGKITTNGSMVMTVIDTIDTQDPWEIGENDYILTAAHECGYRELLEDFQVGDQITVTTTAPYPAVANAQWATGGGDLMISYGELTNTAGWEHLYDGRAPRSALGVKEDGTLLYYAVDGRQTSSVGLTQLELANHLLDEGCYFAVNLDGGGSTSFSTVSLTAPFTLSGVNLVSSPSDGRLRNCSTYVLFADPQIPSQLVLDTTVTTILAGSTARLGFISVRDVNKTHLGQYPTDTELLLTEALGEITSSKDDLNRSDYVYTAQNTGIETLSFRSESYGLSGEAKLEVVDSLSSLYIVNPSDQNILADLILRPDTNFQLGVNASINHVPVFTSNQSVTWEVYPYDTENVSENYGSITESGLFTAGKEDCVIQLKAGGQTASIVVKINKMFDDVPEDHWAYSAIEYLAGNNIVSGLSDTEFGLGRSITRGDFVLMLYRAFDMPEVDQSVSSLFNDLEDSDYASTAISWAVSKNIASGMGDGSFGTKNSITREQAAVIMHKAFLATGVNLPTTAISTLSQYQDQHLLSSYAMLSVASLTAQNLLTDTGDYFQAKTPLTRESMALYLYNMLHFSVKNQESPSQISFQTNEVSLVPGESYSLLPLLEPAGSGSAITWQSSDPSAVTVTNQGVITNVFSGTGQPVVTISATTGSITTSCIVRCMPSGTATSNPSFYLPNISVEEEDNSTMAYTGLVVNAPGGLNVRETANSDGKVVTLLNEGTLVNLHDKTTDGGWYLVSTPVTTTTSNVQGYVMSQYIQEKTTTATVINADIGLNLRAGAGTAFEIIGKLANGTQVVIIQSFSDWYKIQAMVDGVSTTGFVSSSYLELN